MPLSFSDNKKDFSNPHSNILFDLLRRFYITCAEEDNSICSPELLWSWISRLEVSGDLIQGEGGSIYSLYTHILGCDQNHLNGWAPLFHTKTIVHWLRGTRQRQLIADIQRSNTIIDSSELSRRLSEEESLIGTLADYPVGKLGDSILQQQPDNMAIPTPYSKLNAKLAGGYNRGSFVVWAGAQDTGKSTVAAQHAGYLAMQGYKVLFITTEDSHRKVDSRILSNLANIDYGIIDQGVYLNALSEEQKKRIMDKIVDLKDNIEVVDWSMEAVPDIHGVIHDLLDKQESRGWVPDVIIVDWIGRVLGKMANERMDLLRHIMQDTADKLAMLARQRDIVAIGTAQLNPDTSYNKKNVGMSNLSECKTLTKLAQYFIAITGMRVDADDTSRNYKEEQWFNIDKAKSGEGGKISVKRKFQYQRFVE